MEGSDDRILEATLRENAPAPAPWDMRLAATSIAPAFPAQPPPVRTSARQRRPTTPAATARRVTESPATGRCSVAGHDPRRRADWLSAAIRADVSDARLY